MSGIKQPLTYSGRSRGVDDARTVLLRNGSKCAAAGKKPWTVQYFSDSAPMFLGLPNGGIDLYFGPTLSLSKTPPTSRTAHRQRRLRQDLRQVGRRRHRDHQSPPSTPTSF